MEKIKKYNIGLDIGTNSVGWSVVESGQQKIIKKGGKALWGVRLFDAASTAKDRRLKRSIRRRYDRRRQRIKLLQDEFANEINKVDSNFYKKLQDSFISPNDKNNSKTELTDFDKFNIFSNNIRNKINNISEEKKYPTIYHLRNDLVNSKDKKDIRLVYLAIHHIIKYRGNFLYENSDFNVNNINLKEKIEATFNHYIEECMPGEFNTPINYEKIANILLKDSKNEIKDLLKDELLAIDTYNKVFSSEFAKMIVGNKIKIERLIPVSNEEKSMSISFNGNDFDEEYEPKPKAVNGRSSASTYTAAATQSASPAAKKSKFTKPPQSTAAASHNRKIVSFNNRSQGGSQQVFVIKPDEFDDAQMIIDHLKGGQAIVINMEGMELSTAQRIIDFIAGACYSLDGSLQAISGNIFIAAPADIYVSGDLREELLNDAFLSPELSKY